MTQKPVHSVCHAFVLSIFLFAICMLSSCVGATIKFDIPVIELIDLSLVQDGTYYGEYQGGSEKDITSVNVTVRSNQFEEIELIEHYCTVVGKKAEQIIDDVQTAQTNVVDTISGATWSSMKILKAIEIAIKKGIPE
jgi:uncharacterized protein with FMN-binding domain